MRWLITSDLHLTDRPQDLYRFGLFDWLLEQQKKYSTDATFVLGDLTDRKDNHSSVLVNRTIEELIKLKPPVYVLMGNHDYREYTNPYFGFLNCLDGIEFITEPTFLKPLNLAMIPHQRDQASFDKACEIIPEGGWVMLHQTLAGAIAETGGCLTGLQSTVVRQKKPAGVWAGDVHRPQAADWGAYVGSPYQIRFGDDFTPRVLLISNGHEQPLIYPCLKKVKVNLLGINELFLLEELNRGDQVKITISLSPEEVVGWATIKQELLQKCRELGLDVYGIDLEVGAPAVREPGQVKAAAPEQVFSAFCKQEKVGTYIQEVGKELLKQ